MANLTIKDLPESLHRELKRAARSERRSLNGHILHVLAASAEDRARKRRMDDGWKEYQAFISSLRPMKSSVPLIRRDRAR